jgi:hypothetical protein
VLEGQVGGIAGVLEILVGPLKLATVERLRFVAAGAGLIGSASLPAETNLALSGGSFRVGAALLASRRIRAVASLARDSSLGVATGLTRLPTGARLTLLTLTLLTLTLLTLTLLTLTLLTLTLTLLTLTLLTLTLLTLTRLALALLTLARLALTLLALALTRLALTRLPAAA